MEKFKNTEELEKAYKELEKEFTKKSQKLALHEQSNKVLNNQLNKATEHISELEDYYTGYTEALVTETQELKQQLAEKENEYNKLKQCFDKANENCTFDELREIILTGEENSNERVIKILNEQVEALEQQLVEKNKKISEYMKEWEKDCDDSEKEVIELKQQLAESKLKFDKDNETLNWKPLIVNNFKLVRKIICLDQDNVDFEEKYNQDKISFAVEQLEKVKEIIARKNNGTKNGNCSIQFKDGFNCCCFEICEGVDEQIKMLKEGNKNEN